MRLTKFGSLRSSLFRTLVGVSKKVRYAGSAAVAAGNAVSSVEMIDHSCYLISQLDHWNLTAHSRLVYWTTTAAVVAYERDRVFDYYLK